MHQVAIEIKRSDCGCCTRIDAYNQVPGFSRKWSEADPLKAFATNPYQNIRTTIVRDRYLVPFCKDPECHPAAPAKRPGLFLFILYSGSNKRHLNLAALQLHSPVNFSHVAVLAPPSFSQGAVTACNNLALVFKRYDLCACPKRGNLRSRAGFSKRIKAVETDVIPGGDLSESLFPFSSRYLDKPCPGRQCL